MSEQHAQLYFNGEDRTEERLEKALQAVEKALEIDPELPQAHVAMGHYYYWGPRDYAKALEAFGKAELVMPNDPDLMASIAYIRRRQGYFEEALVRLQKAVELDPRSAQKSRSLGTTYISLGRYEEADRQLARTLEISPEAVGAHIWASVNWLLWKGDGRGAADRVDPVLAMGLDSTKLFKAANLAIAGDYQESLELLDSLEEESYPNQFWANSVDLARAWILKFMGRVEESRTAATAAVDFLEGEVLANPNDPRMHGSLGQAYALVGRDDEAIREGERAVKLQPASMDAMEGPGRLLELARIHSALENTEETLELLDQLLAGDRAWVSVPLMEADPTYAFLREQPGYKELLSKHR